MTNTELEGKSVSFGNKLTPPQGRPPYRLRGNLICGLQTAGLKRPERALREPAGCPVLDEDID
jgi:hypothetical protein